MTTRLIAGPPGSGKTTYVSEKAQKGDTVIDLDELQARYGDAAKDVRKTLEDSVQSLPGDVWVIRTLADATARTEVASRLGADEVVVMATPADVCKERLSKRESDDARRAELESAVDTWWNQYGVVESNLIVKPVTGSSSVKEKPTMSDNQNQDLGFPQDTPLAEMDEKQQLAYWKHQSRKHENASKTLRQENEALKAPKVNEDKTPEGDKPKAPEFDLAEFKANLKKEMRLEEAPGKVRDEFVRLIGTKMEEKARDEFLDDLNLSKFVKEDGSLDTAKIRTRAEALAPAAPAPRSHLGPRRDPKAPTTKSVATGRELFDQFAGKK